MYIYPLPLRNVARTEALKLFAAIVLVQVMLKSRDAFFLINYIRLLLARVTRLGNYSPFGRLFTLGYFLNQRSS
jgi:hypothetical protein